MKQFMFLAVVMTFLTAQVSFAQTATPVSNVSHASCTQEDCIVNYTNFYRSIDFLPSLGGQTQSDYMLEQIVNDLRSKGASSKHIINVTKNWYDGFVCDGDKCYPSPDWIAKNEQAKAENVPVEFKNEKTLRSNLAVNSFASFNPKKI